jgi:ferrochelatase
MASGAGVTAGDGVLLVAHGTVGQLEELPAFLSRIRGGRPVSEALIAEVTRRYELIGGSPLLEVTKAQAAALESQLGVPVFVGMRLWDPSIESALEAAAERGVRRLAVIALAPFSVHVYWEAVERARDRVFGATRVPPTLLRVAPWGTEPLFVRAHAELIACHVPKEVPLVLTAHSLPLVAVRGGDPYAEQVRESAQAIARELGRNFELAFQSQGADGGDWLGPDLDIVLSGLKREGAMQVAVAPFGFLGEHVETLYDLDVEAKGRAESLGLSLIRVPAIGLAAGLIAALSKLARDTFDAA